MQANVQEGGSGRIVGLPVLCPAATIPQRWCALSSVCGAVSVRMGPTYTEKDVSPSRSVLVTLVSLAVFEDASILYTYYSTYTVCPFCISCASNSNELLYPTYGFFNKKKKGQFENA